MSLRDFTAPQENISDVALVIDGKRLYVSKQYLAIHSPVFYGMFYVVPVLKDKTEIPIRDVDFNEFLELLRAIYPSHKVITADNVECLLRLSARFNVDNVTRRCAAFPGGQNSRDIPLATKLLWMDRHCPSNFKVVCKASMGERDVQVLVNSAEYAELSEKAKAAVLDNVNINSYSSSFLRYQEGEMPSLIKIPLRDFSEPKPNFSDVALIVDGKRLYVSKQYLALYSPVFHAMFFKGFVEMNKKEVPIEDVAFDEFVELLHVIHPSRKPITETTVAFLLRLADRYNIDYVVRECAKFLIAPNSKDIPVAKKLVWADQLCFSKFKAVCDGVLKRFEDVGQLDATAEYAELSAPARAAVLDRAVWLGHSMNTQSNTRPRMLSPGQDQAGLGHSGTPRRDTVKNKVSLHNFAASLPNFSDAALIVENKRIHVSKQYLAMFSSVFHSMFYSDGAAKDKAQVPIEDVSVKEFLELLHVIHPPCKPITGANVEFLLRLGARFEMEFVLRECMAFLCGPKSSDIPLTTRLLWVDRYRFSEFKDVCESWFKNVARVGQLRGADYACLSERAKAALLDRLAKNPRDTDDEEDDDEYQEDEDESGMYEFAVNCSRDFA